MTKRLVVLSIVVLSIIVVLFYLNSRSDSVNKNSSQNSVYHDSDGVTYPVKVDSQYFYIYKNGKWTKEFIKGVNIGAAKPGYFPGEFAITKKEYKRWFKYISDMNANTIRVYTILKPDFYEALYEYNESAKKPLYFFQGIWVNEEDVNTIKDAHDERILGVFKTDAATIVDIIHGNKKLSDKPGHASGVYNKDVSNYLLGWIEGIEWDPEYVMNTNEKNKDKNVYDGNFLYTQDASPFEAALCEVGDYTINYELVKYNMQHTVSFNNWPTTDMLSHPNEPNILEDSATVNMEHIKAKKSFKAGLFASYHIYSYYPEFMNYQKEYVEYIDENGKVNTYRAYLKDLKEKHTMPVLVAEFGVPSSRGKTHENLHTGFNQGFISETEQGKMDLSMLRDIYKEGYAGGLIFTWQDEWFKRTWNTMDLDIADRRAYWSNAQTNEQQFGILTFDPGKKKSICYVDGNSSEWKSDKPLYSNEDLSLFTKSDEKYVYFMIKASKAGFSFDKDKIVIAIDSLPNQGNSSIKSLGVELDKAAEFVIEINGHSNSRILTDAYYDAFYYSYSKNLNMEERNPEFEDKNSGLFNPIYLCLNRELYLPQDNKVVPLYKYETGKLLFGNGNPDRKEYNSLSDYIFNNDIMELRVPWQLLNIMDPSTKMAMDDLYVSGIKPVKIAGMNIGAGIINSEEKKQQLSMIQYSWPEWDLPSYHERLKSSYYIIKDGLKELK
ncbi:MAG: hypothetical protein K0R71_873 [Bacillales bacterium]|jgi:hypothetical protein|nr:hypothetical protein [Bacillales bacterium]